MPIEIPLDTGPIPKLGVTVPICDPSPKPGPNIPGPPPISSDLEDCGGVSDVETGVLSNVIVFLLE